MAPALVQAISKLAIAGEQAGFSLEDMIQILSAGVSVEGLLQLIEWRLGDESAKTHTSAARSSRWVV